MKVGRKLTNVNYYIPALCECGCKEIVWNKYYKNCKFIQYHGRRRKPSEIKGKTLSEQRKNYLRKVNLGKHSTLKGKKRPNLAGRNNGRYGKLPPTICSHGKRSYYQSPLQGQVCFRSSYELAYAKYLDSIHELWMYEMETFDLGETTYTPDFFLPRREKFIEIKGYMNKLGLQKINMFKEQYTWDLEVLGLQELRQIGAK